jgi:hypothetical protein
MNVPQIISQLPKLAQDDLKTLKAAIEGLLVKNEKDKEPALYEVLKRVIGGVPPYSVFQRTKIYKQWCKHETYAENFIGRNFVEATKLERQALMTFAVQALTRDLRARGVPITVVTVARNLGRFAEAFESEFPNYISSGLQSLILKSLGERK